MLSGYQTCFWISLGYHYWKLSGSHFNDILVETLIIDFRMYETWMNENQIHKNKILRPGWDKPHYAGHILKVQCTRFNAQPLNKVWRLMHKVWTNYNIINPFYNHAFDDHFFLVTLTNCDLNVCSHISYKPLQDCDYRPHFFLRNSPFILE